MGLPHQCRCPMLPHMSNWFLMPCIPICHMLLSGQSTHVYTA